MTAFYLIKLVWLYLCLLYLKLKLICVGKYNWQRNHLFAPILKTYARVDRKRFVYQRWIVFQRYTFKGNVCINPYILSNVMPDVPRKRARKKKIERL